MQDDWGRKRQYIAGIERSEAFFRRPNEDTPDENALDNALCFSRGAK